MILLLAVTSVAALSFIVYRNKTSTVNVPLNDSVVDSLQQLDVSKVSRVHLADDLKAPTNSWFSGIALGEQPQPVYPLPFSMKPSTSSFAVAQPTITATDKVIFGSHKDDLVINVPGASNYKVTSYDKMRVSLTYFDENLSKPLARVTITEGSPYIFVRMLADTSISIKGSSFKNVEGGFQTDVAGKMYGISSSSSGTIEGNQLTFNGKTGTLITAIAQDDSIDTATLFRHAQNELEGIAVTSSVTGDIAETTYKVQTENNKPTYLGVMPHQQTVSTSDNLGGYKTLYGNMSLYECGTCKTQVPKVSSTNQLDISNLSDQEKDELRNTLKSDIVNTTFKAKDTYFGGKELYRAANLYVLSKQLGASSETETIKRALEVELNRWLKPEGYNSRKVQSFYYDTGLNGLVGQEIAFGSEKFNDHHFHYGYLLYAAATLAIDDLDLKADWQPMLDAISADIAAPEETEYFPANRVFDPFMGHSWASGDGQFADGNNQESSSEAVNAWNGLGLWAQASNNKKLESHATWLLSQESASARSYWRAPELAGLDQYKQPFISLNWGGKRDYATFFSADPKAILGIQIIPTTPAADLKDTDRSVANITSAGSEEGAFSDYILMYQAANGVDVADKARELSGSTIDGANSRTYMLAWALSKHNR